MSDLLHSKVLSDVEHTVFKEWFEYLMQHQKPKLDVIGMFYNYVTPMAMRTILKAHLIVLTPVMKIKHSDFMNGRLIFFHWSKPILYF